MDSSHVDYLQCDAISNNPTYKLDISDLTFVFFHRNRFNRFR